MILESDVKKGSRKKISPLISRQDYAYNEIKRMIAEGELSKEERIVERQVSEALGLSRVPVREALLRLNAEGMLVSIPRGGFMVKAYTKQEVIELYQLRDAIESYSAKLAAESGSDEDIQTCVAVHAKLKSMDCNSDYAEYDELFHRSILKACGNVRITEIFNVLHYQHLCLTEPELGYETNASDDFNSIVKTHGKVVQALKDRNGAAAAAAMSEHINQALKGYLMMMKGE